MFSLVCILQKNIYRFLAILLIYFFKLFYCCSVTVVSAFSPHPSTPPQPKPPPSPASTLPLDFVHVSFIGVRVNASPHYPLPTTRSPLAIVRLFLTSMSLVIFCLLFSSVDYVPVKGEIIWYLSLTIWFISLSIMLCSSIHAVAKGMSSFFLSAAYNSIV